MLSTLSHKFKFSDIVKNYQTRVHYLAGWFTDLNSGNVWGTRAAMRYYVLDSVKK